MTYYFPLGAGEGLTLQNVSHSILATTASVPASTNVRALIARYAFTSASTPPNGQDGASVTQYACELAAQINFKLLKSGSTGPQGPTGSQGVANTTCPPNTILCSDLIPSLSAAFPGYPDGLNVTLPSSSRYSIVCMEIPPGCTSVTAICPPYLPISSLPAIP